MSASGELYTIVEDAKMELRDRFEEDKDVDTNMLIGEIADSSTPVYTRDIMEIGMENENLACTTPEMESDGSPVEAMKMVIYDYINQALYEELRVIEQEIDEEEEEIEDEETETEEE